MKKRYNEAYKRQKKADEEDTGWGGFGFAVTGNPSTGVVVKKIHYGGSAYKVGCLVIWLLGFE